MGFFSSLCSKSKLSIPAMPYAELPPAASDVILVFPDNTTFRGHYDGYGRVIDENGRMLDLNEVAKTYDDMAIINHVPGTPKPDYFESFYACHRMVRADHYNGETFGQLPPNEDCPSQGYFYSASERKKITASLKTKTKKSKPLQKHTTA